MLLCSNPADEDNVLAQDVDIVALAGHDGARCVADGSIVGQVDVRDVFEEGMTAPYRAG